MGASWFQITRNGRSLKDAYNAAKEEAEEKYGYDSYNGTISTTHYCEDLTKNFKASGKSMAEFIDKQMDRIEKWHCAAICVENPVTNTNKIKSQVDHIVTPGTKKWDLRYTVYNREGTRLGGYKTKGEAVTNARKYTEEKQIPSFIRMEKELEKGNNIVAEISYKKSSTEKQGRWVFFGWAAE